MTTDIRRLGPADASEYRALRLRALREQPTAFTSSHEEEAAQAAVWAIERLASDAYAFWGGWRGRELCGTVGLAREKRRNTRHKATVIGMYVAPEAAGRGLGGRLMQALVEAARAEGLQSLVLTVTDGNEAAVRLYESVGFRSFGIEPRAIVVDGRAYAKNHMALHLASTP